MKDIAITIRHYASMLIVCTFTLLPPLAAQQYDIVLQGGRVIDPESNLDAVRNVGIFGNTVRAITQGPLTGRTVIDVSCLKFVRFLMRGKRDGT